MKTLQWLSYVYDSLYYGLNKDEEFASRFLKAIDNKTEESLEKLIQPFVVFVLDFVSDKYERDKFPEVKKYIDYAITLYERDNFRTADFDDWSTPYQAAVDAAVQSRANGSVDNGHCGMVASIAIASTYHPEWLSGVTACAIAAVNRDQKQTKIITDKFINLLESIK